MTINIYRSQEIETFNDTLPPVKHNNGIISIALSFSFTTHNHIRNVPVYLDEFLERTTLAVAMLEDAYYHHVLTGLVRLVKVFKVYFTQF